MKEEKDIIEKIESSTPEFSRADKVRVWNAIEATLPKSGFIKSPFLFSRVSRHAMSPFIVALIVVLCGGGTAFASDSARPGDLLFPLDRKIEDVRLRLALTENGREALRKSLSNERMQELRDIIDESLLVSNTGSSTRTFSHTGTTSAETFLQIEADIFTDTTVIKIEENDRKSYFETDARTRSAIIDAIKGAYPSLTTEQIDAELNLEVEDRASRPKDRGVISLEAQGEERVSLAVEEILSFLDDASLSEESRDELLTGLFSEVDDVTHHRGGSSRDDNGNRFEIRTNDDGESRIEIREGDARVRIEEKDGEVRVETREGDDDNESEHQESRHESDDDVPSARVSQSAFLQIEADIFTDTTVIKIEENDRKSYFETDARTRSAIIDAIKGAYPSLTTEQIDAELNLEVEDRASRPKDAGLDEAEEDDNSGSGHSGGSDDDSDDVEDDDEDSDNSGKGSHSGKGN